MPILSLQPEDRGILRKFSHFCRDDQKAVTDVELAVDDR